MDGRQMWNLRFNATLQGLSFRSLNLFPVIPLLPEPAFSILSCYLILRQIVCIYYFEWARMGFARFTTYDGA